jgi:hypothetical protein
MEKKPVSHRKLYVNKNLRAILKNTFNLPSPNGSYLKISIRKHEESSIINRRVAVFYQWHQCPTNEFQQR